MKMKPIFLFLSLVLLCACSSNEELVTIAQHPRSALELSVSAGNFVTRGDTPATRATDNGKDIIFVENDRVGVIVLEGSDLKGNNLPYIYNGTSWSFDTQTVNSENNPGKSRYYYDNQATNVTYIVYFPYSKDADNVTSIEGAGGLKDKFTPKESQQLEADYRASDLMTWTSGSVAPQKKLTVPLSHAYNSVSLLPEVHYTLMDGKNTDFVHPSAISDVNFTLGAKTIYPFPASDGSYRYILSSDFAGSVTCHYTFDGKTYDKALTVSASTPPSSSNIRYSSTQTINAGTYSLDKARVGDFYCRADNGDGTTTGYLIPGAGVSLLSQHQCVGLVFYVGKHATDDSDYSQPLTTGGPCISQGANNETLFHGYVVALTNVNGWDYGLSWADKTSDGPDAFIQTIGTSASTDDWKGYSNQQQFHAFLQSSDGSGWQMSDFPAAYGCELYGTSGAPDWQHNYAATGNSSGWFLPSFNQLKCLYDNRIVLSERISKIKEVIDDSNIEWTDNSCWSSSEHKTNGAVSAWRCDLRRGSGNAGTKTSKFDVRAVCAF